MEAINLKLPVNTMKLLDYFTADKQAFIIDAIKEKLEKIKKTQIEKQLIEGYKETRLEDLEITKIYFI